jgi:hypothetical protein
MVSCLFSSAVPILLAACAAPLSPENVVVTNFGEYRATEHDTSAAPGTASETLHELLKPVFAQSSDKICAKLGSQFGLSYRLNERRTAIVQISIDHPPIHLPDGRITTHEQYDFTANVENVAGFRFHHDYELVSGTWTFAIADHDRVLAQKSFNVTVNCAANAT